jgi:hypothetical protein
MDQMRPWTAWEFENPVHARDLLNAMEFTPCWKAPFSSVGHRVFIHYVALPSERLWSPGAQE